MNVKKQQTSLTHCPLLSLFFLASLWLAGLAILIFASNPTQAAVLSADVELSITSSPEPATAAKKLSHTIVVRNNGPDDASFVTITQQIPFPYLSLSSCTVVGGGNCSQTATSATINFAHLAANTVATVTIEDFVQTTVLSGTLIDSRAEVNSATADPNPLNNRAIVTMTINRPFDTIVTQSHAPEPMLAGQSVVYTFSVRNLSPSPVYRILDFSQGSSESLSIPSTPATSTVVATPFPSEILASVGSRKLLKVRVTLHNLSHPWSEDLDVLLIGPTGKYVTLMSDAGGGNSLDNVTLTFDDSSPQLPKDAKIVSGVYRPLNFTPPGQSAADSYPSPGPGNLTDSAPLLGSFNGLLASGIWKLYVVDDAANHDGLQMDGWSLALTVEDQDVPISLTTLLPAGFVFRSGSNLNWGRQVLGNQIIYTRQLFGVNATSTIVLTATASANPGVNNTSAFLSVPGDHAPANNLSLAPTTVLTNHDLAISNEIAPQPAVANDPMTMTMTITNLGPSAAVNPQIVSSLPAALFVTSIAPSQGTCSLAQNIITCEPGIIASQPLNHVITIQIAAIAPAQSGLFEGTSTVAATDDPQSANNSAPIAIQVVAPTATETSTPTETATATATESATATATETATQTATETPTETPAPSATTTPTATAIPTETATPVATSTELPTSVPTASPLPTSTQTPSPTLASATPSPTQTATLQPKPTGTEVHLDTPTAVPTQAVFLPLVSR